LIERLVAELSGRGYRVATVKHSHKNFDIDKEGKDSWRHQAAGACATVLSSPSALITIEKRQWDLPLSEVIKIYRDVDIIIIEGYKENPYPKLEMFRAEKNEPLMYDNSEELLAVVGDKPPHCSAPFFTLDDAPLLTGFIEDKLKLNKGQKIPE